MQILLSGIRMLYSLTRSLMFQLDPELSHNVALHSMNLASALGVNKLLGAENLSDPVQVMGINFPNRVGLAAGLDKNGIAVDGMAAMGFGFVEVGTVTPRPQDGNPKPRIFRLPEQCAIINRMGFNNDGVDRLLYNLDKSRYKGVLGINIGKTKIPLRKMRTTITCIAYVRFTVVRAILPLMFLHLIHRGCVRFSMVKR